MSFPREPSPGTRPGSFALAVQHYVPSRLWRVVPRPIRDRLHPSSVGGRLAHATVWSAMGTCVSRGLTLVTFVIVARILGQSCFGEWGILRATVAGFQIFAGFGMGATSTKYLAQLRHADGQRAGRVLAMTGLATLVTSALAALLLVLLAPWLAARMLGAPHLAPELRICGALLFLSGVQGWQGGALAGLEAFRAATKVEFLSGIASLLLTVAGAACAGLTGALSGMLASSTLRTLASHFALRAEAARTGVRPQIKGCVTELPLLWNFSLPVFLAAAIVGPTLWLVQALLVNQPGGYHAMAEFAAAHQWRLALYALPALLTAGHLPIAASWGRSAITRSRRMMLGLAIISASVTTVAAALAALLSEPILAAHGTGFVAARPVFVAVLAIAVVDSVNIVLLNALLAAGRAWRPLASNGCWALIVVTTAWLLVPRHGALGLALALLVAQACHLLIQFCLVLGALPRQAIPNNHTRERA